MICSTCANRQPRLGPSLDEVNLQSLEPKLRVLNKNQIDDSTRQIRNRIAQINAKLTESEKESILADAEKEDPTGFKCEKQILEIKEVTFVDQVRCYNTTEEVCAMVCKSHCADFFCCIVASLSLIHI